MHYVAFIHGDEQIGYGITIPDLPGFTAHDESGSLDAAIATGRRVLADHIAALVDAGREIPAARSASELEKDEEAREEWDEAFAFVMLPVIYPAGRTLRVNVTLDEATLSLIDSAALDRSLSRSGFIAEAARRFADGEGEGVAGGRRLAEETRRTGEAIQRAIGQAAGTSRSALSTRSRPSRP
jgi:predicted RNase H-like HicB family nuclease